MTLHLAFLLLLAASLFSAPLAAQDAPPAGPPAPPVAEPVLVFDREVFSYEAQSRRDPFTSLLGKAGLGPRFEDLQIKGIILSGPQSIVLLSDGTRTHRARRGDVVGNARVVEISANRVIFAVENFGQYRQEVLELKRKPEGAQG